MPDPSTYAPPLRAKRAAFSSLRCLSSAIRAPGGLHCFIAASLLLLPLMAAGEVAAQSSSDGSLYSRFGLGELQSFSSAQGGAMGDAGFALHSLNYLNFDNPATWADQVLTRASAGFTYQNIRITDASNAESRLASGYLNGVRFGFPILQQRLGVALGFVPYSRVSYSVVNDGTIYPNTPDPDTVRYVVDFTGSGGLQQVIGGFGYRFNRNFSAGVSLNGLFGIIDNGRRTSFIQSASTSQFTSTNVVTSTRLTGLTATMGAYFNVRGLLAAGDYMALGAAFTLPTTLSGRRVNTLGEQLDRDTLGTAINGDVELPWRLGLGLAYQPNPFWTLSAGGHFAPWTDFRSTLSFPGYEPGGSSTLTDRWHVGAGVEIVPAGSDQLASYFARVGYRLGIAYDQSYVSPEAGLDLRTAAGTAGLSLPTLVPGTRLDINLQVGRRGKTEGILVQDVFYRLAVGVNFGERWFQTPRLQ